MSSEDSEQTVCRFMDVGLSKVGEGLDCDVLVKVDDIPANTIRRKYNPRRFAEAGSKFSTERKLRSPVSITWMPSSNCATDCIYCYANKRPIGSNDFLTDSRNRELIQEIADLEIPVITFTGGDPFMHKRFLDYLEIILEAGIGVELPTKVPLNKEQVQRLAKTDLDEIQIGIDGDLPPFFGPVSMRGFHSPVLHRALAYGV